MNETNPLIIDFDQRFMKEALKEAAKAYKSEEVPVGCVIVHDGIIIGRGHNRTESLQDPTAHAEILAITSASENLKSWRLNGCTLYCTVEPCAMCAGAIVLSRIDRVVFGTFDPKFGACGSLYNILQDKRLNHTTDLTSGILGEECTRIIQDFFRQKRKVTK